MFTKKTKVIHLDEYPTGVCVKAGGEYWYVQGSYKRKIPTLRILLSWTFPFVLNADPDDIASLTTAKALGFRDGTIVKALDGSVFLISERQKRRILNPDFLEAAGVHPREIQYVSEKELSLHELGRDLN